MRGIPLSYEQKLSIRARLARGERADLIAVDCGLAIGTVRGMRHKTPTGAYNSKLLRRQLNVLPSNNNALPVQACGAYAASLTVAACAERHERAQVADVKTACARCEQGQSNLKRRAHGWAV